ncbi:restriction endonuclease subunit S [Empedobacter stercoris]|uniref:restriction endonuclease subunit S n=1 Tax=Empedobacter stercoris TaxID=1628248 RepID=UPI001CE064C9|nr:restriction endonuclease subunit S [Empedobacter stercoris]MCA4781328.1 restriction endonuclease subunit S [Empedobacter stercoris]
MREGDALSLPKGWKEVKIEDLGTIGRGKSKHRPRNADFLFGDKYPFVQTADVKDAEYKIYNYSQMYSEAGLAQSKLWPKGTLCITIAANIADAAILGIDACFPDSVVGFIPDDTKSDVRFVKYLFDLLQVRIKKISQGAAQDNLSLEKIRTLNFQVPPLETQKKIASILSGYDDLIENNLKRIKILEEMAQQTYEEWFVRMRFPGYESVKINKETGLPEGWERLYFKNILNFKTGKLDSNALDINGEFDFYTCAKEVYKTNSYCFEGEAVLLGGNNATGDFALFYADSKFDAYQRTYIVTSKINDLPLVYVYQVLRTYLPHFKIVSSGASTKFLTMRILDKTKIVVPNDEILKSFFNIAKPCFENILNLQNQNQRLREARDILLPRLMMGMIEV